MRVVAHRGDSFHAPENTLEAGRLGHDAGADAWEVDVHLSSDGVPVIIHDESLARTTDVATRFRGDPREADGFRVADFLWEEIRTLDAGSWFLEPGRGARSAIGFGTIDAIDRRGRDLYRSGTVRVPSLEEVLRMTAHLDWHVNVELKSVPSSPPGLLGAVLEAVDATKTADRVLISSFDHAEVAASAGTRPEIPTGVLVSSPLHRPAEYLRDLVGALAYHPSADALGAGSEAYRNHPSARSLRRGDVASLAASGIPVLVYTVNNASPGGLADHLEALGVAAVFTDDPRAMIARRR